MTHKEMMTKLAFYFGSAGKEVALTLTESDAERGLDFCLEKVAPTLEEKLFSTQDGILHERRKRARPPSWL